MLFRSLLVFWFGLLYFILPFGCTGPAPGLGGGEEGAEVVLLVGSGPSLCLAGTLLGDGGAEPSGPVSFGLRTVGTQDGS